MGAPYTFLNFAMEDVIKAYFETNDNVSPPLNVYRTCEAVAEGIKMAEPNLVITCSEAGPVPGMDVDARAEIQNQSLAVTLAIRTHATNEAIEGEPDTVDPLLVGRSFHARTVGRIMDLLFSDDLVLSWNNLGNNGGLGIVQIDTPRIFTAPTDRSYTSKITFQVHAYPFMEQQ